MTRSRAAIAQANLRLETELQEALVAMEEWELLGVGRPTPLAMREPQIAEARALLLSAEAALAQAEYDLERTIVRAPYAGRVRQERVDIGQFLSQGNSVATLYSVDAAEVRLPIPDAELAYVALPLGLQGRRRFVSVDRSQGNLTDPVCRPDSRVGGKDCPDRG